MSEPLHAAERAPGAGARIELLDLWRTLSLLVMVLYHLCYDLMLFGRLPEALMTGAAARVICYAGGGSFILLSGTVARFSRDPLRRGFLALCAGLLVAAATALVRMPVVFGILELLGICLMLYGALKARLERLPALPCAAASLLLFAGTWLLTARVTVRSRWLYPFGLRAADFFSADYWPLLPWLFLFLLGTALGKRLERRRDHPLLQRRFPAALTFPGRHSLVIYLLHQPLLWGACWLLLR